MKTVKKSLVKEMARLNRKYAKIGDVDILPAKNDVAKEISRSLFGTDLKWSSVSELFSSLCGVFPLKHCTNDEICDCLKWLGFEVINDDDENA